jgi:glucose/arabinose dehydrogenase
MPRRLLVGTLALGVATLAAGSGTATRVPSGYTDRPIVRGLRTPIAFAFLPGGRILVAEKRGVVRLLRRRRLHPRPFLDIRARVNTFNERGLVAIAVRAGHLYAYYALEQPGLTLKAPTGMRLSRFRMSGDRALASSEVVLVGRQSRNGCAGALAHADCIPANCGCHIGGDIAFGAGGSLYLSTGDAATAGFTNANALRAQDLDSLAGKLLRVDTAGRGLRSNPFWSGRPHDNRSRVWAFGLRNPFRFVLDPRNGVPVVGDVGWLDWEEIDFAVRGANLGWPCYEGSKRQTRYARWQRCADLYRRAPRRLRGPLYQYARRRGAGIIGGAFGRNGVYYFADVVRGWIRALPVGLEGRARPFAAGTAAPVALETGPDGNLWYLTVGTGQLRRIRPG